jgi:hypothetical protein
MASTSKKEKEGENKQAAIQRRELDLMLPDPCSQGKGLIAVMFLFAIRKFRNVVLTNDILILSLLVLAVSKKFGMTSSYPVVAEM